jgi:hypothetical protein
MDLLCFDHGEILGKTALARAPMIDGWAGCGPGMAALFLPAVRGVSLEMASTRARSSGRHYYTGSKGKRGCHINYLVHPR